MSHCILKTSPPPAKSILLDAVDSVELFCHWLKDSMQWGRRAEKKDGKAMSVLEYRTGDVKVHHATDDDDDDDDLQFYTLYKKKNSFHTLQ